MGYISPTNDDTIYINTNTHTIERMHCELKYPWIISKSVIMVGQSLCQPSQSVSQSVGQSVSQTDNSYVRWSFSKPALKKKVTQSIRSPVSQPVSWSVSQSVS